MLVPSLNTDGLASYVNIMRCHALPRAALLVLFDCMCDSGDLTANNILLVDADKDDIRNFSSKVPDCCLVGCDQGLFCHAKSLSWRASANALLLQPHLQRSDGS